MSRAERVQKIQSLLATRRGPIGFETLREQLEVSPATLKRDIRYLREHLGIALDWDREAGGYRSQGSDSHTGPFYTEPELLALLTLQRLLQEIDPAGLIAEHLEPLAQRLDRMLPASSDMANELRRRVRIVGLARRTVQPRNFQRVGLALAQRRRLRITYLARSSGTRREREISPLRLLHYRENWHLDAWCHLRDELRNFSVDAIEKAEVLHQTATEVDEARLDALFNPSYGIFSGQKIRLAQLRFSPERARWVAQEQWHPQQTGRWDAEGRWLLDLPYADERELVMDILRHVPEVEVLGPRPLREAVRGKLEEGLKRWQGTG